MSKKRIANVKTAKLPSRPKRRRLVKLAVVALIACLLVAGTAATQWEPLRRRLGLAPTAMPAPPQQGNLGLSKEYIYAGGRLLATEEGTPPGPPPTGFLATATAATNVSLTWTAPASGVVTGYVVARSQNLTSQPVEIVTGSGSTSFVDSSATSDTAYLYQVRAIFTGGGTSLYSNSDLATTVVFTDASLQGVVIKADHLKEARRAVNAVRALAVPALGPSSWTYPDPVSTPPAQRRSIYLEDMTELRTNLNPALSALGITLLPDDPTLVRGLAVKGDHIQTIRDKVR